MSRRIHIAALAIVTAGAVHLSAPPPARATMAPAPNPFGGDGVAYCCSTIDGTKHCCFETGCGINNTACWKL